MIIKKLYVNLKFGYFLFIDLIIENSLCECKCEFGIEIMIMIKYFL